MASCLTCQFAVSELAAHPGLLAQVSPADPAMLSLVDDARGAPFPQPSLFLIARAATRRSARRRPGSGERRGSPAVSATKKKAEGCWVHLATATACSAERCQTRFARYATSSAVARQSPASGPRPSSVHRMAGLRRRLRPSPRVRRLLRSGWIARITLQPNLLRAHAHAWSTPGAVGLAGS